ncbi:hypothetical protein GW17_00058923, partial [Ensete ventricosum]
MAEMYRGHAVAAAWGEGMACHATLMGVGLGSVVPGHLHLEYTRSAADLVPRADVTSSEVLMWLSIWRG